MEPRYLFLECIVAEGKITLSPECPPDILIFTKENPPGWAYEKTEYWSDTKGRCRVGELVKYEEAGRIIRFRAVYNLKNYRELDFLLGAHVHNILELALTPSAA